LAPEHLAVNPIRHGDDAIGAQQLDDTSTDGQIDVLAIEVEADRQTPIFGSLHDSGRHNSESVHEVFHCQAGKVHACKVRFAMSTLGRCAPAVLELARHIIKKMISDNGMASRQSSDTFSYVQQLVDAICTRFGVILPEVAQRRTYAVVQQ